MTVLSRFVQKPMLTCATASLKPSIRTAFGRGSAGQQISSGWIKATQIASDTGRLAVLGTCGLGLGSLCLYGLLQPTSDSVLEQSVAYPAYVRERIRSTYVAYGSGLAITAATAVTMAKRPHRLAPLLKLMDRPAGAIGAMALCFGSGIAVQVTPAPQKGSIGFKHLLWGAHSALLGTLITPAIVMFGPLVGQAALYTGGALAGLSAIAITAPSDKFLMGGGILGMGFAALFTANIASMFVPMVAQPFMVNVVTYGGVVLFSGFILHYTQGIVHRAKAIPPDSNFEGARPNFDSINNAIGLYTHTLNLFMHILQMLALNNGRRK